MKSGIRTGLMLVLATATSAPVVAENNADKIARGQYLVTLGACGDCHTPLKMGSRGPEPDLQRLFSGHPESLQLPPPPTTNESWPVTINASNTAWAGPWGISYTANLTPDPETGIGNWSLHDFRETLRTGKHLGVSRPLLPPMPVAMYRHLTDQDLEAMYFYLRSLNPVRNRVPAPVPPSAQTNP